MVALAAVWIMIFHLLGPYMDTCRLTGSHVARQTLMLEDIVVQSEASQDRRVVRLEPAYYLLAVPYCIAVERLHLTVVRVPYRCNFTEPRQVMRVNADTQVTTS